MIYNRVANPKASKMRFLVILVALFITSISALPSESNHGTSSAPFLNQLDNQTWVIGNGVWNVTQGPKYGVKLFYKNHDCVGDAVGHYVSYSKLLSSALPTKPRT